MTSSLIITLTFLYIIPYLNCVSLENDTPYCDNNYCEKTNTYCCGYNECCFVWTLWYLCLALGIGISVGVFFIWKCYLQKKSKEFHKRWLNSDRVSFKKKEESAMSNNGNFTYMPLNNNATFLEKKIDDHNIHFNLMKQP